MAGRRANEALAIRRDFVRVADAERRWRRAFWVLLQAAPAAPVPAEKEGRDGHDGGGLRAGVDGAAGRAADD